MSTTSTARRKRAIHDTTRPRRLRGIPAAARARIAGQAKRRSLGARPFVTGGR